MATPLAEVLARLCENLRDPLLVELVVDGLVQVVEAQHENFPENIFWDVDLLFTDLLRQAGESENPGQSLAQNFKTVVALQKAYGRHSPLSFQYVHDFIYGFDWIKWISRGGPARSRTTPFNAEFLAYLLKRATEIEDLIDRNDNTYPQLARGRRRNPFGFSRTPEDERRLHEALASRGLIPVECWHPNGRCRPDFTLYAKRRELAAGLGLMLAE